MIIYIDCFFNKLVDILNFSFEREREYHISTGSYSPGYKHNIDTIKNNLNNSRMTAHILCNETLEPISFLYLENNENDYDKLYTMCTDNKYRNKGMGSLLLNNMITNQLNNKRNKMILEVYNDKEIGRNKTDILQNHIVNLFSSKGFKETPKENITEYARNNLVSHINGTKIMTLDPKLFIKKNNNEMKNLNTIGKTYCCN